MPESITEIKALIEEQGKAWKAFRETNDQRLEKLEAGLTAVAELETKLERVNSELDKTQEQLSAVQTEQEKADLGGGGRRSRPENRAFAAFMRTGDEAELKAAASVQSDPDGGWHVPDNIRETVDRVASDQVAMRRVAAIQQISQGSSYTELVTKSGATAAFVGETASRPETDSPDLAKIETTAHEIYAAPRATQRLLDDSFVDIEQWLADEVGIAFAETEGEAFITGSGVEEPLGILSCDTVDNGSYEWGKLGFVKTGKSADWADSDPEDAIVELVYALKSSYRNGASFIMNRATLGGIRKFKTSMGYLWQPSMQAGQPSLLLGYPVYEDDNMEDVDSADNFSVAFGNFARGYRIVDHVNMRLLRDPYSNKPYVTFYITMRVGGQVRNFEAIKLLKTAS